MTDHAPKKRLTIVVRIDAEWPEKSVSLHDAANRLLDDLYATGAEITRVALYEVHRD